MKAVVCESRLRVLAVDELHSSGPAPGSRLALAMQKRAAERAPPSGSHRRSVCRSRKHEPSHSASSVWGKAGASGQPHPPSADRGVAEKASTGSAPGLNSALPVRWRCKRQSRFDFIRIASLQLGLKFGLARPHGAAVRDSLTVDGRLSAVWWGSASRCTRLLPV